MPAPLISVPLGPWERVLDTARAGEADPTALRDLADGYIAPDGRVLGRPGMKALATHPGAPGLAQGIAGMRLSATDYTFAVVGGVLASYDWSSDAWTTIALSGVALSSTTPVALVPFFDKLIVSDGVHRPWYYDPASTAMAYLGMETTLGWYGRPVVRDAKLFGIRAGTARRTVIWSEEADISIGGNAVGYSNLWDLRQTAQEYLTGLVATNNALIYGREHSTGQILGSVNAEFKASGTHDEVSASLGTASPFAMLVTDEGTLWSLTPNGRPYFLRAGAGETPLWLACQNVVATIDRTKLDVAWALYLDDLDAVAFALPSSAGKTTLALFARETGAYLGRWTPRASGAATSGLVADFAWGANCTDEDGVTRLALLDSTGKLNVVWRREEAEADTTKQVDTSDGDVQTLPPTRMVLPDAAPKGADQSLFVEWTQAIVEAGNPRDGSVPPVLGTAVTQIVYDCEVPTVPFNTRPKKLVSVPASGKKTIGLQRFGRWLRFAIEAFSAPSPSHQRFNVWRVTLVGFARDAQPRRR